jgi:hypothetical protein
LLIGLLVVLPLLGDQIGLNLNFISQAVGRATGTVIGIILQLTANS